MTGPAVAKLVTAVRREGPAIAWFKALHELGVFRRLLVVRYPDAAPPEAPASALPLEKRLLDPGGLRDYLVLRPDQRADQIARRLSQGHRCFMAYYGGRPICSAWASAGRVPLDFLEGELVGPEGVAYGFDVYTAPDCRGRNVATEVLEWRRRLLRDAGHHAVLGVVWPENRAALRRAAKNGCTVVGTVGFLGVSRWRWYFARVRAPDADPTGHGFMLSGSRRAPHRSPAPGGR